MEKKNSSELVEINATVMKETANSINNLIDYHYFASLSRQREVCL